MRTKALLGLAALAVSAVTCVAQSNVYSLNIVGYVNVPVKPGLNLIANPLNPSNGNTYNTNTITLPDTADGALLFTWAGTAWSSVIPSWVGGFGWDTPVQLALGQGFFLQSPAAAGNYNVTFVGEVQQGTITTTFNKGLNAVANKVPVDEAWPGKTVGNDGDQIFTWNGSAWDSTISGFIGGFGWDSASTDGPVIKAGQGVMYNNTGTGPLTWTRTFNPQ